MSPSSQRWSTTTAIITLVATHVAVLALGVVIGRCRIEVTPTGQADQLTADESSGVAAGAAGADLGDEGVKRPEGKSCVRGGSSSRPRRLPPVDDIACGAIVVS